MSHYSSSPRHDYVVLHHTGWPGAWDNSQRCSISGGGGYDFAIGRNGHIYVCAHSSGQPYWERSWGEHAIGCNDYAVGIHMNGCFGGCDPDDPGPSREQECSVAFLLSHLDTPDYAGRVRPHARCNGTTRCPGEDYTSGGNWNGAGASLRDRIRSFRRNWDDHACCEPGTDDCPV